MFLMERNEEGKRKAEENRGEKHGTAASFQLRVKQSDARLKAGLRREARGMGTLPLNKEISQVAPESDQPF